MKMSNKVYDVLKWLCLIVAPALAYGYGELGNVWGLPYTLEIPKTINIVAFVIGVCIGVSTLNYNKEQAAKPTEAVFEVEEPKEEEDA